MQAGRVCGVNQGEVVRALPYFVTKQARVFFLDQLETNEQEADVGLAVVARVVCD